MPHVVSEVRRCLLSARVSRDSGAVVQAYSVLKAAFTAWETSCDKGFPVPSELYILCCEEAIALNVWNVAEECEAYLSCHEGTSTRALEARALYCRGLVQCHRLPGDLRGGQMVEERIACASSVMRGITLAVEEWPREAWVLVAGVEKLWFVLQPLYQSAHYGSLIDLLAFMVCLHERLQIGGPFTHVQWVMRYATALRGLGRQQEALAQINTAIETMARVGNERLQIQLLRIHTSVTFGGVSAGKGKVDPISVTKPQILHQAVYLSQLCLCGYVDSSLARVELISIHDRLVGSVETDTDSRAKSKGKTTRAFSIEALHGDSDLIEDVLSDVVLSLCFCNEWDRCEGTVRKLHRASRVRPSTFAIYAETLHKANEKELLKIYEAPDASYVTNAMSEVLFDCIAAVERGMESARMITDVSERAYTLQMGCCLLWNFCLPLMQSGTHHRIRSTLRRIVSTLDETCTASRGLQVRAEYESSLAEFEEDNLSLVVVQVRKALSRGLTTSSGDGTLFFPMDPPLLWLQCRTAVRGEPDSGHLSPEKQALYNIEQARLSSVASKRFVLLKGAFNKLPSLKPVQVLDDNLFASAVRTDCGLKDRKRGKLLSTSMTSSPALGAGARESNWLLANVYHSLLVECIRDLGPSLIPVALNVARALTSMELRSEESNRDLICMKGDASLSLAGILIDECDVIQLPTSSDGVTSTKRRSEIVGLLKKAGEISRALQSLGFPNSWITINACQMYLNWHAASFSLGRFAEGVSRELADLYDLFMQLTIDFNCEYRLTVDLGLMYILSLLQDYLRSKGDDTECVSYEAFMYHIYQYPRVEANSPVLKRALEVCREVMQKIHIPSRKASISMLYPCVCRLSGAKLDSVFHPQEQLLLVLGRIAGPMHLDEKRALLRHEATELLHTDPAVQLCGRMVVHAINLHDEQTALDVCQVADKLYEDGQLGWGSQSSSSGCVMGTLLTASAPSPLQSNNRKGVTTATASPVASPLYPKPLPMDWLWYARLLLVQATIVSQRCDGSDHRTRQSLSLRVLTLCTNSCIAASHGPPLCRETHIVKGILLFYQEASYLWKRNCPPRGLLPCLQMLLSTHILEHLNIGGPDRKGLLPPAKERVAEVLNRLGYIYFKCCGVEGALTEGMQVLQLLQQVLPQLYCTHYHALEVEFRSRLGAPVAGLVQKTDDPVSDALAWTAVAKSALTHQDSMLAWKEALAAVQAHPFARASCLLEMTQQLCEQNRLRMKDVLVVLQSALDEIEGFTTSGVDAGATHSAAAAVRKHLVDGGSRTLPLKLRGTLSWRSLLLSNTGNILDERDGKGTAALKRGASPLPIRNVLLALRIVFLLFSLTPAPTDNNNGNANCKREWAILMVHYIECLWRLVANRLAQGSAVDQKTSTEQSEPQVPLLTLPNDFGGWCGFFFDPRHADVFRRASTNDAKYNNEAIQVICLELADYLFQEHMEPYCFIVYSWAHFSACWRYGCNDFYTLGLEQLVMLKCQLAAASCGCGPQSCVYTPPHLPKIYWSTLQETLFEGVARKPNLLNEVGSGMFIFLPSVGGTPDILCRVAETLDALGCTQEATEWVTLILPHAEDAADISTVCRCVLQQCRMLEVAKQRGKALTLLRAKEADGVLSSMPLQDVVRWCSMKARLFCTPSLVSELPPLCTQVERLLQERVSSLPPETLAGELGRLRCTALVEEFYCCTANLVSDTLSQLTPLNGGRLWETCHSLLHKISMILSQSTSWGCRLVAVSSAAHIRPCVTDLWLHKGQELASVAQLLGTLYDEANQLQRILLDIREDIRSCIPTLCSTSKMPVQSSLYSEESRVMQLLASNAVQRLRISRFILEKYRSLSLKDLSIPGGGPTDLEAIVVQFMRDPTMHEQTESAGIVAATLAAEWESPLHDVSEETRNAFAHFDISHELVHDASRFVVRDSLYRSKEVVGSRYFQSYYDAAYEIVRTEFSVLLEQKLVVLPQMAARLDEKMNALLNVCWALCPITVVEQLPVGRKGAASEKNRSKRLSRADTKASEDLVPLREKDSVVLASLLDIIRDAENRFDFSRLSSCFTILSHMFILWKRPRSAGWAIEFAQASKLYGLLVRECFDRMEDTTEARAWRKVQMLLASSYELSYTVNYTACRKDLLTASSMLRRMVLLPNWPAEPESASTPSAIDGPALTIVQDGAEPFFLVCLRHVNGITDCRRVEVALESLEQLTDEVVRLFAERKQQILQSCRASPVTNFTSTEWSMSAYLTRLEKVVEGLFADFMPTIVAVCRSSPLYLCLDPILQPLPLELLPCFSEVYAIQRALSVTSVYAQLQQRTVKQSHNVLYLIDMHGEYPASIETVLGSDHRAKSPQSSVITCTRGEKGSTFPPPPEYLFMMLGSPRFGAVLVDTCGPFYSLLSPSILASLELSHVQNILLITEGVNELSARREQKGELTKDARAFMWTQMWFLMLLLLARGVHFIATNTLPNTPALNDTLCKRCMPSVAYGKGIVDLCAGNAMKGKSATPREVMTYFGACPPTAKLK